MYLFIFESIGTSELILIGVIALIVFGPRKLPQMSKTIGKTMADFRRTTNEFKSTWEREAEFYKEENIIDTEIVSFKENKESKEIIGETENTIAKTTIEEKIQINSPQIEELNEEKIKQLFPDVKNQIAAEKKSEINESETESAGKREWL